MKKKIIITTFIFLLLFSSIVMASHSKIKKRTTIRMQSSSIRNSQYQLRNSFAPNPLDVLSEDGSYNFGKCLDTDGGLGYFTAGSATYFPPMTSRCQSEFIAAMEICGMFPIGNCLDLVSDECKPRTTGDRCIDGNTLREAYCSDNSVRTRDYRCPSGCSIAQCISFR